LGLLFLFRLDFRLAKRQSQFLPPDHSDLQFSIAQLLLLSSVIAGVTAVSRFFSLPHMSPATVLIYLTSMAIICLFLYLVVLWATLSSVVSTKRNAALATVTAIVSCATYYGFFATTAADNARGWAVIVVTYVVTSTLLLRIARHLGLRLIRNSYIASVTQEQMAAT
jgi:hypothetical protein